MATSRFIRFLENGARDPSFGVNGSADIIGWSEESAYLESIAIDDLDRLVAVGSLQVPDGERFLIVRHLADGRPDPSFGDGGRVIVGFGDHRIHRPASVETDASNRVILFGILGGVGIDNDENVAISLLEDGSPDPSFGAAGTVFSPLGVPPTGPTDMVIDSEGRVVATGTLGTAGTVLGDSAWVARWKPDGSTDFEFGDNGFVQFRVFDDIFYPSGVVPNSGELAGRLTLGGVTFGLRWRFAAIRFRAAGAIDGNFGDNGRARVRILTSYDMIARCMTMRGNDLLLAGVRYRSPENRDVALVRLNSRGNIDHRFGLCGYRFDQVIKNRVNMAAGVAVDAAGRIVVGGEADRHAIVIRYRVSRFFGWPVVRRDPSFGNEGAVVVLGGNDEVTSDLAIDSKGRIVIVTMVLS
jgi:uncharacterized delta-60 repeat protein